MQFYFSILILLLFIYMLHQLLLVLFEVAVNVLLSLEKRIMSTLNYVLEVIYTEATSFC